MSSQSSRTRLASEKDAATRSRPPRSPKPFSLMSPPGTLQRTMADPASARRDVILKLQRSYGNQAVQRLLAEHTVQAKLTVGPAGDAYEQEADRVAGQVMTMPAPARQPPAVQRATEDEEVQTKPLAGGITPLVQRQAEEEEEVQTKRLDPRAGFEAGADVEAHLQAQRGGGSPLPEDVRAYMEPRFGADFSGVRVHTGSEAAQLNRAVSAQAFTHGQDIYIGEGRYSPCCEAGKRLLAHELTHVVQQGAAPAGVRRQEQPIKVQVDKGPGVQRTSVPGLKGFGNFTDLGNGKFGTDQPTDAGEVAGLVNEIGAKAQNLRVKILSGTHGDPSGNLVGEENFYREDLVHEGFRRAGWINVFNVLKLRKARIGDLKEPSSSVVILAWCFSKYSDQNWAKSVNAYKTEADYHSGNPIKDWAKT